MSRRKLIVCDICDTLYDSNTTFDFLNFLFSKNRFNLFLFSAFKSKWSPVYYFLEIAGRFFKEDLVKQASLRLLKGRSENDLVSEAFDFYDQFLSGRANESIFDLLKTRSETDTLFLISSSISPVVQVIGSRNNMEVVPSLLEWKAGRSTGRLQRDLSHRKHEVVKSMMAERGFTDLRVITDNRGDLELVEMASERFVVIKSEADKKFWNHLSPHFILV
jgi:phosphoserine phosphatase